jgi:hypothetical protein
MRLLLALAGIAVAMALSSWFASDNGANAASRGAARTVAVRVGDRIRVLDTPIGCRIAHMRELQGRIVIDCRRAGSLRGTYGTLLTAREAGLMRFESDHTAKLVYVATHHGGIRRCGSRP